MSKGSEFMEKKKYIIEVNEPKKHTILCVGKTQNCALTLIIYTK